MNNNNFLQRLLFFLTILVFTVTWLSDTASYGTSGIPMALLGGLLLVPTVFFSARNIFNPAEEQPPSYYGGGRRARRRYLQYYNKQKVRNGDEAYFKTWLQGEIFSNALMLIILVEMAVSGAPVLSQILVALVLSLQITEFISILSDYKRNKKDDNRNQSEDPWDL